MKDLLFHLTHAVPGTVASLEALVARTRELAGRFELPFDRAVAGGFDSDRVAYAFGGGYQAALACLLPGLEPGRVRVFCVSEERGGHPRAIATRLEAQREGGALLHGAKRWTTFGPLADELLVVATTGVDGAGRNQLKLARVDPRREGVTLRAMPPTPFAPELPHAELTFAAVRVAAAEILDGDAYERYVKPFRTVEDIHVLGAFVGHVAGLARAHGWSHDVIEEALAVTASLRSLAPLDPLAAETHVALAGAIRLVGALAGRVDGCWGADGGEARERWSRDRVLLDVASGARAKRLESALRTLGNGSSSEPS
jgi:alkylation response protein AidB-like acyl-CoA dehydrogenase